MKMSTLAKLESDINKIASKNNLKVTSIMKEDDAYRVDFEEVKEPGRVAGFSTNPLAPNI